MVNTASFKKKKLGVLKWIPPFKTFEGLQKYLGFSWKHSISHQVEFYVFTVLPFGLSSAPHVFTKILKPLDKHWKHQGICVAVSLDDGWGS